MSDVQTAEQLWARAHEHVRRGDFAPAVRDLSTCFQILQALGDPRVYEVHKRWTEVHQLYLEDGARPESSSPAAAPSLEAEAEAAANDGDLDRAIELYTRAAAQSPQNELVRERLQELLQARRRADELVSGTAPPAAAAPPGPAFAEASLEDVALEDVALEDIAHAGAPLSSAAADQAGSAPAGAATLDTAASAEASFADASFEAASSEAASFEAGSLEAARFQAAPFEAGAGGSQAPTAVEADDIVSIETAPPAPTGAADDWSTAPEEPRLPPQPPAAEVAPTMAVEDAPVGMQSLDVPFSVGEAIDSFEADDLPVAGTPSLSPTPTTEALEEQNAVVHDIAFLEELLARVQANRRRAS
jgi:hypothetical protein